MQAQWRREAHPNLFTIETKPLTMDSAPIKLRARVEPERPTRFVWIVLGVALLFGFVLGGGYWLSEREQTLVAAVATRPPGAPAKPAQAAVQPPAAPPMPQLALR